MRVVANAICVSSEMTLNCGTWTNRENLLELLA
jgi:hypothetical protein